MAEPKKIGRPTKCTPEVTAIICAEVAKGIPKKYACRKAGVDYTQMNDWEKRGEAGEEPFATFARELADARAAHIAMRIEAIESGAGDWKRHAFLAERLEPSVFGQVMKNQLSGPDGGPIQTQGSVVVVPKVAADPQAWAAQLTGGESDDNG